MGEKTIKLETDLCLEKPEKDVLFLGDTKVSVVVTVRTKRESAEITRTRFDRCVDAAKNVLAHYCEIVTNEIRDSSDEIERIMKNEGLARMRRINEIAEEASRKVHDVYRKIQGEVDKAVDAQLKREARDDRNLQNAEAFAVFKGTFKPIKILSEVGSIVASLGTNVIAYAFLVKDCVGFSKFVWDQSKDEKKLREELKEAIKDMYDEGRRVQEREEAEKEPGPIKYPVSLGTKAKLLIKGPLADYESKTKKAEAAHKKYDNHVTKMRQNIDKLSVRIETMQDNYISCSIDYKNINREIKIGDDLMLLRIRIGDLEKAYKEAKKLATKTATAIKKGGVEMDDKQITRMDVVKSARDITLAATNIAKIVNNFISV